MELGEGQPSLSVLLYRRFCSLRASPPAVTVPNFWAALPGVLLGQVGKAQQRARCQALGLPHPHCAPFPLLFLVGHRPLGVADSYREVRDSGEGREGIFLWNYRNDS